MRTTKEQIEYIQNNAAESLSATAGVMFGLVNMYETPYNPNIHGTEQEYFDMIEEKTKAFDLTVGQENLSTIQAATIIAAFAERFKKIVIEQLTNKNDLV